ncbi:hypothetical protein [Komagataeibacter sp. FNDCF1]|uniref:hypothetical protein n=1 Tax=Komagataeibacter sp. FNDCF1 TaxID=2878681 RepID=UPI001E50A907|nr:hypothetical protein [Komagataeibacter sp. FNDCF1]MCE2565731.1 hypothetical protein [Komagataeibacter sp. FNDCF1]
MNKNPILVDDLPDNINDRHSIVILTDDDVEKAISNGEGKFLVTSNQTTFLRYNANPVSPLSSSLKNLICKNIYTPGNRLIANPFIPSTYELIDRVAENVSLSKLTNFSNLCSLLGAKSVSTVSVQVAIDGHNAEFSFPGSVPQIPAELAVSRKKEKYLKYAELIKIEQRFSSSEADLKKSEEYLYQSGLSNDPLMINIFNIRKNKNNKAESSNFEINTLLEIKKDMDIVFEMKVPTWLSMKYNQEKEINKITQSSVKLEVVF